MSDYDSSFSKWTLEKANDQARRAVMDTTRAHWAVVEGVALPNSRETIDFQIRAGALAVPNSGLWVFDAVPNDAQLDSIEKTAKSKPFFAASKAGGEILKHGVIITSENGLDRWIEPIDMIIDMPFNRMLGIDTDVSPAAAENAIRLQQLVDLSSEQ